MKRMEKFITKNAKETGKLAKVLAKEILKSGSKIKKTLVFGLVGNLGAGKTTFIKAFANGMGIKRRLTSPTFVLMKKYKNLYHIDCYRIRDAKDILALDFKEIISIPQNIVLIEWAEKIKKILPKNAIWLKFKIINERQRLIIMK